MKRNLFNSTTTQKFATDGIPIDLAAKFATHLKQIDYYRWAELKFKHELTGA